MWIHSIKIFENKSSLTKQINPDIYSQTEDSRIQAMWTMDYYANIDYLSNEEIHYGNNTIWENNLNLLWNLQWKKILELWCWTWENSIVMSKSGWIVTWIDIENNRVKFANIKALNQNLNINFLVWDANNLHFDDDSFDIIESSMVLEYVWDIEQVLKEIKRVLKPGWKFVFCITHEKQIIWDKKFDWFEMYSKKEIELVSKKIWLKLTDYTELSQIDTRQLTKQELAVRTLEELNQKPHNHNHKHNED